MIRWTALTLALSLLLSAGCADQGGALGHAEGYADAMASNVRDTAKDAGTTADRIQKEAKAGAKATPHRYTEAHKHWYAVGMLGETVRDYAARLLKFGEGFDVIKTDLAAARDDQAKLLKRAEKAESTSTRSLRTVQVFAVIGIGVFIAVGLLVRNVRLSVVGAVGALATGLAAQAFITYDSASFGQKFWMVLYVIGGTSVGLFLLEALIRRSFKKALATNPLQDIRDMVAALHAMQAEPAPVIVVQPEPVAEVPA